MAGISRKYPMLRRSRAMWTHQKVDFARPRRVSAYQKPVHDNWTLGPLLQSAHGQNLGVWNGNLPVRDPPIVQRVRSNQKSDRSEQIDCGAQRRCESCRRVENQIAVAEPQDRHTGTERKFHQPQIILYRRSINDPQVRSDRLENIDRLVQTQRGSAVKGSLRHRRQLSIDLALPGFADIVRRR